MSVARVVEEAAQVGGRKGRRIWSHRLADTDRTNRRQQGRDGPPAQLTRLSREVDGMGMGCYLHGEPGTGGRCAMDGRTGKMGSGRAGVRQWYWGLACARSGCVDDGGTDELVPGVARPGLSCPVLGLGLGW